MPSASRAQVPPGRAQPLELRPLPVVLDRIRVRRPLYPTAVLRQSSQAQFGPAEAQEVELKGSDS